MNFSIFKRTALTCAAFTILSAPAMANDMINNQAYGTVFGSITQEATGYESELTVEVGSIEAAEGAYNNRADGFVNGDINQRNVWHGDSHNVTMTASVGAINAEAAINNDAFGTVNGEIRQEVLDGDVTVEAYVGSIQTDGFAANNRAEGYVDGDIYQIVGHRSTAKVRVGAMTN